MISFTFAKWPRSVRKTVMRTARSSPRPAAAAIAARFLKTRWICASMPSASCIVAGSKPICPDTYTVSPARTACEYVPIAAGASLACTGIFTLRILAEMPGPTVESLEKLIGTPRDGSLLRYSLGLEYSKIGDTAKAIEHLKDAVLKDPDYSAAWRTLGKTLEKAEQIQEALQAYRSGIAAAQKKGDKQAEKEMTVFARRIEKKAAP